mmetsp:Transcript_30473/g.65473  ORF Transcript_30473/g.65473 Transcript_30473/m.65473 type:complete len:369 (-) Transcript_30473:1096-2202(-)
MPTPAFGAEGIPTTCVSCVFPPRASAPCARVCDACPATLHDFARPATLLGSHARQIEDHLASVHKHKQRKQDKPLATSAQANKAFTTNKRASKRQSSHDTRLRNTCRHSPRTARGRSRRGRVSHGVRRSQLRADNASGTPMRACERARIGTQARTHNSGSPRQQESVQSLRTACMGHTRVGGGKGASNSAPSARILPGAWLHDSAHGPEKLFTPQWAVAAARQQAQRALGKRNTRHCPCSRREQPPSNPPRRRSLARAHSRQEHIREGGRRAGSPRTEAERAEHNHAAADSRLASEGSHRPRTEALADSLRNRHTSSHRSRRLALRTRGSHRPEVRSRLGSQQVHRTAPAAQARAEERATVEHQPCGG